VLRALAAAAPICDVWQPEAKGERFVPNTAGFALRVPDVERAGERLTAAGVEFLGKTLDPGVWH
jgi:hypothetical protein